MVVTYRSGLPPSLSSAFNRLLLDNDRSIERGFAPAIPLWPGKYRHIIKNIYVRMYGIMIFDHLGY